MEFLGLYKEFGWLKNVREKQLEMKVQRQAGTRRYRILSECLGKEQNFLLRKEGPLKDVHWEQKVMGFACQKDDYDKQFGRWIAELAGPEVETS